MSGHSKWHSIKHKKGAADAKRGKIFTRLIKELTVAARAGGGDPDMNPRLRTIIADAKQNNMPADNIKRAIRRGTGEEPGVSYEEVQYEGFGPGGVSVIVEALTDNRNRTASEVRAKFSKNGGNLGATGSVSHAFDRVGMIKYPAKAGSAEERAARKVVARIDKQLERLAEREDRLNERMAAAASDYEELGRVSAELSALAAEKDALELEWLEAAAVLE